MQEMITNGLLAVIIIMSAFLLLTGKNRGLTKKQKKTLIRILVSTVVLLILQLFAKNIPDSAYILCLALYLADYLIIGYDILIKAFKGIINGQVFDVSFLIALVTV